MSLSPSIPCSLSRFAFDFLIVVLGKNTFVLLGEYPIGNTNTVIGIFKIAKFISLVREWSMEELWPWC